MKRILSALLLAAMLAASLAACGGSASDEPSGAAGQSEAVETEAAAETDIFTGTLAQRDYDGAEFRILGRSDGDLASLHAYELTTEAENGEIVNDTVFARNVRVEEYYNASITAGLFDRAGQVSAVSGTVLAGDCAWDLVWGFCGSMSNLAVGGYLADLRSFDGLSLEQPWWNQTVNENLTVAGRQLLAFCDLPFTSMLYTHCMFVNKRLAGEYLKEDIYDTVNGGQWTLDQLLTVTADLANDVNGDGALDLSDSYGFLSSYGAIGIFSTSANLPILHLDADGKVVLDVMSDAMQTVTDKTYRLAFENNSTCIVSNDKEPDLAKMFAAGQSLFYSGFLSDPLLYFRDMADDFALIPFPKYDAAQDGYYTSISGGNGMLGIPKVVRDAAFTADMTEALALESWRTLRPAVFETVMVGKLLRDEESAAMFDTIVNGISVNFGWLYTENGFGRTLRDLMSSQSADLASYYAKKESSAQSYYESVVAAYLQ